jgi:hypothetical protein
MFLFHDLLANRAWVAIGDPIELGHQFGRPDVRRRIAVTGDAKSHIQRFLLMDLDHLVDAAMAAYAAHSRGDMGFMVEEDEIRKPVNVDPGNRLASAVTVAHQLQPRALILHFGVAVHADLRRRDGGEGGFIYGVVAVEAIEAQIARVELVAVRHGLHGLIACVDHRRIRIVGVCGCAGDSAKTDDRTSDLKNQIRGLRKNGSHAGFSMDKLKLNISFLSSAGLYDDYRGFYRDRRRSAFGVTILA